jgi:cobalamin biosynthesis protein CobC
VLVVDEAFVDTAPPGSSLAGDVTRNIIVLRSFGKFFGLAGIRLGFALLDRPLAGRLAAILGPWPLSGPALAIGAEALADTAWIEQTRRDLAHAARRLDAMLAQAGVEVVGGSALFRLARTQAAYPLFHHLGRTGILVRIFPEHPDWLRFGLPGNEAAWRRLEISLGSARDNG